MRKDDGERSGCSGIVNRVVFWASAVSPGELIRLIKTPGECEKCVYNDICCLLA